jgi:hypothetical protein
VQIRIPLVPYTPSLFRNVDEAERISAFYDPSERAAKPAAKYVKQFRETMVAGVEAHTAEQDASLADLQIEALSAVKYLRQGSTDQTLPDGHEEQREFWEQFPFRWRHELANAVAVTLADEDFLGKSSRQPA